ncbi:MAG TPA: hypothetical protein VK589_29185, partial [Chryseolinea sp.]|nr:hypothetical protein [Chryseolinea sp.]
VGSRILPVKINDLDPDDKALIELELNGVLRSVEFIYKEPGVNRPLEADDNETKNLNGTKYRNQVNKVANAIKEIINSIKRHDAPGVAVSKGVERPARQSSGIRKSTIAMAAGLLVAVAAFGYFMLPASKPEETRRASDKSIAVLPFADLSERKDQEWFSDGLTEELLNSLANVEELRVIARTSSFAFKGTNIPIQKIADSLHVSYILEGSVRKQGEKLRITAQLIQASDGSHIWSQTYDRPATDIFSIQEDISKNISTALNVYLDETKRENMFTTGTHNVEAYEAYLKAVSLYEAAHADRSLDLRECNKYFEKAIALDPSFAAPYYGHHDLFAHYIMNRSGSERSDSLTTDRARSLMQMDLNSAIANARSEEEKLFYEIDRTFLSDNWTALPRLIKKLESDEQIIRAFSRRSGWSFMILMGIDQKDLARRLLKYYSDLNPLDIRRTFFEIYFLVAQNKPDSALIKYNEIRVINESDPLVLLMESDLLIHLGKYKEAYDLMRSKLPADNTELLMIRAWAGETQDVKKIVSSIKPTKRQTLQLANLFALIHKQAKADSLAHRLDAEMLGPQFIIDRLFGLYGKLPFNLSATPNLSARLREAGIDLEDYQKRNFISLPAAVQ